MTDTFFIVKDDDDTVANVWNYRHRDWCWDVDAYYSKGDGFAYTNRASADKRAKELRSYTAGRGYTTLPLYRDVRVVTREQLFQLRELDDHAGTSFA